MPRIRLADDAENAVAADNDAVLADAFDGGTNLHDKTPCSNLLTLSA